MEGQGNWDPSNVIQALQERNRREVQGYGELVASHLLLQEKERTWRNKASELQVRATRLQEEKESLIRELGQRLESVDQGRSPEDRSLRLRVRQLEAQVQQDAVKLEQQRRDMEASHSSLAVLQQDCQHKAARIRELEGQLSSTQAQVTEAQSEGDRWKEAAKAAETKVHATAKENEMLIERWTRLKLEEAEKINEANALYDDIVKRSNTHVLQSLAQQQDDGILRSAETGAESLLSVRAPSASSRVVPGAHPGGCTSALFLRQGSGGDDFPSQSDPFNRAASCVLITAGEDGVVRVWDSLQGGCTKAVRASPSALLDLAQIGSRRGSPPGVEAELLMPGVLAASADGKVYHWDAATWQLQGALQGHTDRVFAVGSSGGVCASASADKTVRVWDVAQGMETHRVECLSVCHSVCFAGPHSIVTGHADGHLRQWDLRQGTGGLSQSSTAPNSVAPQVSTAPSLIQQVAAHVGHSITSVSMALLRSSPSVLTCGKDASLKLFDLRSMEVRKLFRAQRGFQVASDTCRAAMSPSEGFVACGAMDGSLVVWEVVGGGVECVLKAKTNNTPVLCCAWSPLGLPVVSGDKAGNVTWWS